MIVKYKILMAVITEAKDVAKFEREMNEAIASGWKPQGGLAIDSDKNSIQVAQAIVLVVDKT